MIRWGLLLALAASAPAHDLRPLHIEISGNPEVTVKWRTPPTVPAFNVPEASLPGCEPKTPKSSRAEEGGFVSERGYRCSAGLAGQAIEIRYPVLNPSLATLIRVKLDGRTHTKLLSPKQARWFVPERETAMSVSGEYGSLGVRHILEGADHLLFVFGLVLLVRNRWMLFKTITSFTVAHSITLALATLGYASAPTALLEAAIALSILFLGAEIMRKRQGRTSLAIERPWLVAFAFGLLHGFGFAGGLTSIGLPGGEIPAALFGFNVGVELGQLLFVALILLAARALRGFENRWLRWAEAAPAYAVGCLGAFWTIERTVAMLGGAWTR